MSALHTENLQLKLDLLAQHHQATGTSPVRFLTKKSSDIDISDDMNLNLNLDDAASSPQIPRSTSSFSALSRTGAITSLTEDLSDALKFQAAKETPDDPVSDTDRTGAILESIELRNELEEMKCWHHKLNAELETKAREITRLNQKLKVGHI